MPPIFIGSGLATIICFTALGMLIFAFRAYREGSYRRGAGWYLDVKQRPEGPLPAYRRPPRTLFVPPRLIRVWAIGGASLIGLAVFFWTPLHVPGLGIIVGVFGLIFVGGALGAWRQDSFLRRPMTSPLVDIVDRGQLRFSPRTDALVRQICELGGRERLEREFGWREGPTEDPPIEELHARLDGILAEIRGVAGRA